MKNDNCALRRCIYDNMEDLTGYIIKHLWKSVMVNKDSDYKKIIFKGKAGSIILYS